jgi:hypothetical protein
LVKRFAILLSLQALAAKPLWVSKIVKLVTDLVVQMYFRPVVRIAIRLAARIVIRQAIRIVIRQAIRIATRRVIKIVTNSAIKFAIKAFVSLAIEKLFSQLGCINNQQPASFALSQQFSDLLKQTSLKIHHFRVFTKLSEFDC